MPAQTPTKDSLAPSTPKMGGTAKGKPQKSPKTSTAQKPSTTPKTPTTNKTPTTPQTSATQKTPTSQKAPATQKPLATPKVPLTQKVTTTPKAPTTPKTPTQSPKGPKSHTKGKKSPAQGRAPKKHAGGVGGFGAVKNSQLKVKGEPVENMAMEDYVSPARRLGLKQWEVTWLGGGKFANCPLSFSKDGQ